MTDRIDVVYAKKKKYKTYKKKLSCIDRSNLVQFVTKTKQDNNMIYHIGAVYVENETKLLWSNELGTIFNENQIG